MAKEIVNKEVKLTVGIGASAGGLAVLKKLVTTLPKNQNIVYLIVMHLDPSHSSMLTELLERESTLPVKVAEDNATIAPDTVYVIPPNSYLELKEGKIKLTTPTEVRGMRRAIDHLFRSLAEECKQKCVGVILTGAGNDGTAGLRVLKAAGGFAIAQNPKSAEHSSMPESAISTGVVDKVLKVEDILAEIINYAKHPYLEEPVENNYDEFENSLLKIGAILESEEDFNLELYKPNTIHRRIARRMGLSGMKRLNDYIEKTMNDVEERKLLIKDLLINVTDFFRDPEAFDEIENKIIPNILESIEKEEDIRIWVAGCATGEEVYSLAILFTEALKDMLGDSNVRIFATDVDEEAIATARKGIYSASVVSEVPSNYLEKYFSKLKNDHYQIKGQIRDLISFANQNVAKDPPFSQMHLISCRNLLIYLKKNVQDDIISAFHFALKPEGYMFLGSAESINNSSNFNIISKKWRIYKKVNGLSGSSVYRKGIEFVEEQQKLSNIPLRRK